MDYQVLKNVVTGNEVSFAIEFDEREFGRGLSESEETFGGSSRRFLGSQNLSPFPEFLLSGIDVPIGIDKSGFNVLNGSTCSFSQLLYQIHIITTTITVPPYGNTNSFRASVKTHYSTPHHTGTQPHTHTRASPHTTSIFYRIYLTYLINKLFKYK